MGKRRKTRKLAKATKPRKGRWFLIGAITGGILL